MQRLASSRGAVVGVTAACAAALTFAAGFLLGTARAPRPAPSVLDQAEQAIARQADAAVSTRTLTAAAIRGMLATLDDRWASYTGPGIAPQGEAALSQVLTGRYSGVGVWLTARSGTVTVAGVVGGSPAARAGLVAGEELLAVAGRRAGGLGVAGVVDALRGPAGSTVVLQVTGAVGGAVRTLTLRRASLADGAVSVDTVAPGIVRIAVTVFSAGVGSQVAALVRDAQAHHVEGIVLDLRGDPGGLLSEGLAVSSAFLDGGPVVSLAGLHQQPEVLMAAPGGDVSTPLAVLVDGGTASAAEVVAAALEQRGRAVVIGSRTFGKDTVQEPIMLSDGALIEVTVARYRTPDGRDLGVAGLEPEISVPATAAPQAAVTAAVEVLQGLAGGPRFTPAAATSR